MLVIRRRTFRASVAALAATVTAFAPAPPDVSTADAEIVLVPAESDASWLVEGGGAVYSFTAPFPNGFAPSSPLGHVSTDAGGSWEPITMPVGRGVADAAVTADGTPMIINNDPRVGTYATLLAHDGEAWAPVPAFAPVKAAAAHTIDVAPDGDVWVINRPLNPCGLDRYEVLRSRDGGSTATTIDVPLPDGAVPWGVAPGPDGHVVLLAKYPHRVGDDCFTGGEPGTQLLTRDGGSTWQEFSVGNDVWIEVAEWVGDRLVAGVGIDRGAAQELALIDGLVVDDEEEAVEAGPPVVTDRAFVAGERRLVSALRYGASVLGLSAREGSVIVHSGLEVLSYTPSADALGDATSIVDLADGTGLMWGSDGTRPVLALEDVVLARDARTILRIR